MSDPTDQSEELRFRYRLEIERVGTELQNGTRPSQIANDLHAKGLGAIEVLFVFREATGAPLRDLKTFGQWWSHAGVTDANQFDAWAAELLRR